MSKPHAFNRAGSGIAMLGALIAVLLFSRTGNAAEYTLCAFRSGDRGPCTCRTSGDAPGQFSLVSRKYCRTKKRTAQPKKKIEVPQLPEKAKAVRTKAEADAAESVQEDAAVAKIRTEQLPKATSTIAAVRERGRLRCGVNTGLVGFSARGATGVWEGIDVDFCRAVAVATLGHPESVDFIALETQERFDALVEGKVDLLSRNTTWTMNRVVDYGVEFVGVAYFDGQGFLTRQDRGLVSAQQLEGLTVCVQSGTTTQSNLDYYFSSLRITADVQAFDDKTKLIDAYMAGQCDSYTADRSALFSDRVGFPDPHEHEVLPETISKEPLGPVVRQDDRQWVEIVRWTLAALINAEETGLTRERAAGLSELDGDALRLVEGAGKSGVKLGLHESWLRDVVASVGHYGEIFESNLGKKTPLGMERGMNSLWKQGGLLYAPLMW